MVSFITHNLFFFRRKEVWFYQKEKIKNSAYTVYIAARHKPSEKVFLLHTQLTNCIDLSKSAEELFQSVHPTIRYDIKMGEKQEFAIENYFQLTNAECEKLIQSYNSFACTKGIKPIEKNWLLAAQEQKCMWITRISLAGFIISAHIYIHDTKQIILTHSYHNPDFTNNTLRGYANKLLHWKDIVLFKEKGLLIYNWGGVNPSLQGISEFKTRFGGNLVEQYSYIKINFTIAVIMRIYKLLFRK